MTLKEAKDLVEKMEQNPQETSKDIKKSLEAVKLLGVHWALPEALPPRR
jgi:hypothetical protein